MRDTLGVAMNYTGIEYHKRYSVACTLYGQGCLVKQGRIDHYTPVAFVAYFKAYGGPSEMVIEACWNWAALYDLLETRRWRRAEGGRGQGRRRARRCAPFDPVCLGALCDENGFRRA